MLTYRLIEPIDAFEEGEVLELTERFGDWHLYDVKLEPAAPAATRSVEMTWDELRSVTRPADTAAS